MKTPFKIDVYFLSTSCWGWALEPDESIVKLVKTYDLSIYPDNKSFQAQMKLDANGLNPVPAYSHIFGKIYGWSQQRKIFDLYTLWSSSSSHVKTNDVDFTIGDYVVYTVNGYQFPVNRVLAFSGNYLHFYNKNDFYFERSIQACHKNHLLTELHEKVLKDLNKFDQAAFCLFKYAVTTTKEPNQVASLVGNYFLSEFQSTPLDTDSDFHNELFKRNIDSNNLALEFIYKCLTDKKIFGLANSPEGALAAKELFDAIATHP